MSGNEYVKYVTEEFISYLLLSTDEKKKKKIERKNKAESPVQHWFGIVGFAITLFIRKKRG